MVDMAHYAGLIAAGLYPNPVPHADVVTSTTHKSLRGPRGGIVLMNNEAIAKKINSAIFPGIQGGPLMHVIAAKAVAFKEALAPEFKALPAAGDRRTRSCSPRRWPRAACASSAAGPRATSCWSTCGPSSSPARRPRRCCSEAHMTCNKNGIPNDPQKPMVTSGIRLGTPALTTRGFKEGETRLTANLIADVLDKPHDEANIAAVRGQGGRADARLPGLPVSTGR